MNDPNTAKLTPRQRAFVDEYLVSLNAADAARKAGYSENTAKAHTSRLLGHARVAAEIKAALARRAAKTRRAALHVLTDIQAVSREAWESGDLRTTLKALELEGKHLGMFTDKLQVSGKLDLAAAIEEGRRRAGK